MAEGRDRKKHAVKVCSIVGPEEIVRYMRREFQLHQTIQHKNVVRMYGGIDTNRRFVVMDLEYCDKDLQTLIRERKDKWFTQAELRKMFRDILEGLNALHSRGIAHRDLKPANLLVTMGRDDSFTVKVADLGFAKREADGTQSRLGTPLYEAPEVMVGTQERYGVACDIWSIGVVFQEILFRAHPYGIQARRYGMRVETRRDIEVFLRRQVPMVIGEGSKLSDCCRHFVNNFVFYDPECRYSAPEALEHPFLMEPAQVVSLVGKTSPTTVGDLKPADVYFGNTVFDKYLKASSFEKLSQPHAVASWDVTWGDIVESSSKGTEGAAAAIDPKVVLAVSSEHEIYRMSDRFDPNESKNLKVLTLSCEDLPPELTICDSDPQEGLRVNQFLMNSEQKFGAKTIPCLNSFLDKGTELRRFQRSLIKDTNTIVKLFEFLSDTMFNNDTAQALLNKIGTLQEQASEAIEGFAPIAVTLPDFQNLVLTDVKGVERGQKTELHSFTSSLKSIKAAGDEVVSRDRYHIDVSKEVTELRNVITSFIKTRELQASQLKNSFAQLKDVYAAFRNRVPALFLAFSYIQTLREALNSRTPSSYLPQLREFSTKFAAFTQKDEHLSLLETYKAVVQERDRALEDISNISRLAEETARRQTEIIARLREVLRQHGIPDPTVDM